ncbi:MAG: primosomal protein N' [Pseudomonadota bacterium]
MSEPRISVLLPLPLAGPYDYLAPEDAPLAVGQYVVVPLGPREVRGVVWAAPSTTELTEKAEKALKTVIRVLDAPPLTQDVRNFVDWVAAYTLFPQGAVLRMVMRSGAQLTPPKPKTGYVLGKTPPQKTTEIRAKVLAAAGDVPQTAQVLAAAAGCGVGVIKGLADAGALVPVSIDPDPPYPLPDLERPGPRLSPEQNAAAEALKADVVAGGYKTTLIDGVTGSGKTEVYFEAIAAALRKDPTAQVLVLMPEIALTLQFIKRVEARFGVAPTLWHSDAGDAGRRRAWRRVADGGARIVVGARSALFLPFQNLSLIIVDEEHDSSYKQEDGVLYQARDMAVARGARKGFPVILASATPALETMINVTQGRYSAVTLPGRFGGASMPETETIDLRAAPPDKGQWLSPKLIEAVDETLDRGEQAMLFLNRRGYAPLTICRKCGHRLTAPHSDTWLVEHRYENKLVCHHTGFSMPKPKHCPACGAEDSLAACGPGVERVGEEAKARWPDRRVAVFSSDTVQAPGEVKGLLADMAAGRIDILIATQIAAKGHHFPNLTLIGVVDADLGLSGGDLRAGERTYQLLNQVAGRAGRAEKKGRALLQTYQPNHPVMRALISGDRDTFLAQEAEGREMLGFPPYGRLAAVILTGEKEDQVRAAAQTLAKAAPHAKDVEVWGPAPAPIARLRGRTRMRFLVKAARTVNLQAFLTAWRADVKTPSSVRVAVDVDPYSFL